MDAEKRLMGTMVQSGRLVNHVSFRPHGTTFGLLPGNHPEIVAAGEADWRRYWMSVTAGPRLLTDGRIELRPGAEGFTDPAVVRPATRTALGFSRDGARLYLASFPTPVSLEREAAVMKAMGAYQALNLDGGTSRALAERGTVVARPGRPLTIAVVVYDRRTPAPAALRRAFAAFRENRESPPPLLVGRRKYDAGPFAVGRLGPIKSVGTTRPYSFEDWLFTRVSGRPAVRNHDGWLELVGDGHIQAPWRGPAVGVAVLGRLTGPAMSLHLDGVTRLEIRERALSLRRGDRVLAQSAWPIERARHLYALSRRGSRVVVWVDGKEAFTAAVPVRFTSLGFSGAGAFKSITPSRP
jgi:hypothetical protein